MSKQDSNTQMIYSTKNYNMFKILPFQRDISVHHVQKLKKSLESIDMLRVNPIIVDKNHYIIDGQHRLRACREMKIPVYYCIMDVDALEKNDVILNINTQEKWRTKEFIEYHTKLGNEEYVKYTNLCKRFSLNNAMSKCLVRGVSKQNYFNGVTIKNGELKVNEDAEDFCEKIAPFYEHAKNLIPKKYLPLLTSQSFFSALYECYHLLGNRFEKFLEALKKGLPQLVSFKLKEDYMIFFDKHANKGMKQNYFNILEKSEN